jgi:hypothetical protein
LRLTTNDILPFTAELSSHLSPLTLIAEVVLGELPAWVSHLGSLCVCEMRERQHERTRVDGSMSPLPAHHSHATTSPTRTMPPLST